MKIVSFKAKKLTELLLVNNPMILGFDWTKIDVNWVDMDKMK